MIARKRANIKVEAGRHWNRIMVDLLRSFVVVAPGLLALSPGDRPLHEQTTFEEKADQIGAGDILDAKKFATVDGREVWPSVQHNRNLER